MSFESAKPVTRLQQLTRLLGWQSRLRLYQHQINEEERPSKLQTNVITWYETGISTGDRSACFLQINESPQGQTTTYSGAVYAIRYRICTGWHDFRLPSNDSDLRREAARLWRWLAYDWFSSVEKRRAFRQAHPECAGYTWRRIRTDGPPEPQSL
jgi:hypothetical protein